MQHSLKTLAEHVGARIHGDPDCLIGSVATLQGADANAISFLTNPRYRKYLQQTRAGAVILCEQDVEHCPVNALVVDNPHAAYARIATLFEQHGRSQQGIHPSAEVAADAEVDASAWIGPHTVIGAGVRIGAHCYIGPNCVLEHGVQIGENCTLVANVTVYHQCTLGKRVNLHAGVVIGSDGFGFAHDKGHWIRVPQLGSVRIGDDVDIGANTTVDRGAIEDTVIEEGVKLDNQIQVAHNVRIGAHTVMAGCVGIAGSTTIGKHCAIGGGVGILGHLEITDGVTVTATSLVTKSIKIPGVYSSGTPLEPNEQWHKNFARFKQLDQMARRLKALEKELNHLKEGSSCE